MTALEFSIETGISLAASLLAVGASYQRLKGADDMLSQRISTVERSLDEAKLDERAFRDKLDKRLDEITKGINSIQIALATKVTVSPRE